VDPIERIDRATAFAAEKVAQVQPSDLSKPTPCSEYDLRTLLNHVIGNLTILTTAAQGEKAQRPEGDQFGSDPGAEYGTRREALLSALRTPGVLDGDWQMPFGTLPASTMASIAFVEHLTHGWDVARSTGRDGTLPADLVPEGMDAAVGMGDMLRMPGVCGPAVAVPDGASAQDRFIAFMGRTP
jgi:uncharacterized protein (TIGR03086 family)